MKQWKLLRIRTLRENNNRNNKRDFDHERKQINPLGKREEKNMFQCAFAEKRLA